MMTAPLPPDERERLARLHSYGILDTADESEYDDIAALAAEICGTPFANISFVDSDRQWFKAVVGLEERETSRDIAFCAHTILGDSLFTVPDAHEDPRFRDNPLVTEDPGIRFYAGMPLETPDGYRLGALCAIDTKPRRLTEQQQRALGVLARHVVDLLELRLRNRELERMSELKTRLLAILAHDLRSPIAMISSGVALLDDATISEAERGQLGTEMRRALVKTEALVDNIVDWARGQLDSAQIDTSDRIDLSAAVDELCDQASTAAARKHVELRRDLRDAPAVTSNLPVLQFILRNLIGNAIKYTSEGHVLVSSTTDEDRVRVTVTDTGVGMPPEIRAALFDWSSRPRRDGTAGERGSGIALLLCADMAQRLGATMEVESEVGVGTAISLVLPR